MLANKIGLSIIGVLLSSLMFIGLNITGVNKAEANPNLNNGVFVLAMGANTHGLTQANADAKRFADTIENKLNINPENVVVMKNVTKESFEYVMDFLSKNYYQKVFVYFSGHGARINAKNRKNEGDCFDEALVFSNKKYRDDDFVNQLNMIKTEKLTTILDTCFSGGMTRASCPHSQAKSRRVVSFCNTPRSTIKRLKGLVLTASTENQLAWEVKNVGGRFTQAFIGALWEANGSNPVKQAFDSASRALRSKNMACTQTPQRFGKW